MRFINWAFILVGALFYCSQASAACSYPSGGGYIVGTVSFGSTVIVPRGAASGTVLTQSTNGPVNRPNDPVIYTCDGTWQYQALTGIFPTLSTIGGSVYNTNIPGVGIKVFDSLRSLYVPFVATVTGSFTGTWYVYQLIKTSTTNVSAGTLNTGNVFKLRSNANYVTFAEINLVGTTKIVPTLCSLNTPNINITLADVALNELSVVGSTAKSKVFNVGLDCDANAKISVKLTGTQDPDASADGVLKLTGAGSANVASGVGIQILYNNTPMVFNNTIALKTSTGGLETFPFTAQYYQTKSTVSAGTANATATLGVTYQ